MGRTQFIIAGNIVSNIAEKSAIFLNRQYCWIISNLAKAAMMLSLLSSIFLISNIADNNASNIAFFKNIANNIVRNIAGNVNNLSTILLKIYADENNIVGNLPNYKYCPQCCKKYHWVRNIAIIIASISIFTLYFIAGQFCIFRFRGSIWSNNIEWSV